MFRLLGKESRINNRMSLAIVFFKSALTFLRHRNPESERSAGLPGPRGAVFSSLSHQKVYSRDQETARSREKNTDQKSQNKVRNQTRNTEEKDGEEGEGGRPQRPESRRFWAPSGFFPKTSSGFRNASYSHKDPPVVDGGLLRWGGRRRFLAPPLPCKRWL